MTDHFHGLTPAEAERLAMLAEEAGEIVQMVGKILRHGYASHHPDRPSTNNRALLRGEIDDFLAVMSAMEKDCDISVTDFGRVDLAWDRKVRFSHHQAPCRDVSLLPGRTNA